MRSFRAAFISELELPLKREDGEKKLHCVLTAGQESLRFYWFTHLGYKYNFYSNSLLNGNQINYGITLCIRINKPNYNKPDLVLLLENTDSYYQKSYNDMDIVVENSGSNFNIAPTFILTYRNFSLRGGMQFGVLNSGSIAKTDTNGKITLEIVL